MNNTKEDTKEDTKLTELFDMWYERGEKAGKEDGWMRPAVEDFDDVDFKKYEDHELAQMDNDGWEETEHFNYFYGEDMYEDALEIHPDSADARIDLQLDLRTEFWNGYEETSGIYEMIKEEREKRRIK